MDLLKRNLWPLAAGLVLTACGGEAEGGGPQAAVVDTVHVRSQDVPNIVTAVGTVEADHQTEVMAEVSGQVVAILRDEGSSVAAGTPIIQIDPDEYRNEAQSAAAELARAQAQLEADSRQLERFEKLLEAGAVDQATYDDLVARVESGKAAVEQARAALGTARLELGKSTVRAPFAGTVGTRHVELGAYVSGGGGEESAVFDLVDDDPLKVRFSVPELYANDIETGDEITFRVRTDTVEGRQAQVDYVSPGIDPETRTLEVTAVYTNPDDAVRPGAYADVRVTTSVLENAAVVPEVALYTEGTDNYIYVVRDSTAERRAVELGPRVDGRVVVLSGVRPGEAVITAGHTGLQDGALVRVVPREERELRRES
ncbi:MAG: efflux RND transporter periplasmic adaptor subunit [Gemmatimonadota bacterium]